MDITVRKAQIQDIPDIIKMNDIFNGAGCTVESVKESLKNCQNEIVFVAVHNNTAVGIICGQMKPSICYADGLQCEITELFVCENYRKKGIAIKLIKQLELEFEKNNVQEIILQASKKNIAAQKLYKKCGYDVCERVVYRKYPYTRN